MSEIVIFSSTFVQKGVLFRSAGVHRIATEIRKRNLSCQVIQYLHGINENFLDMICKKFISKDTILVCFSTTLWSDTNETSIKNKIKQIIDYTKTISQKIQIVFGGTATELFINNYDGDVYFTGYGEQYFIPWLESLIQKNSKPPIPTRFLGNKKIYDWSKELDRFHFSSSSIVYDKSDLLMQGEVIPLELARGCIFKCKFCQYPLTGKKKLNYVKDSNVLYEELIRNYEDWGITKYVFTDDTFNDNNEKLDYLANVFKNLPFKLQFTTYLRHDLLYSFKHQIDLLREMGLVGTYFGVETFDPKAGKLIGKGLDPLISKNFLYEVKEKWGQNVTLQMGLIFGIPYEDPSIYKQTIDFIQDPNCPIDGFNINPLTVINPSDGSVLHYKSTFQIEALKYGFTWENNDSKNWTNSIGPIKTFREAKNLADYMLSIADNVGRLYFGGLSHLPLSNIVKFTKYKTMENWEKTPILVRHAEFYNQTYNAKKISVALYINNLLNL